MKWIGISAELCLESQREKMKVPKVSFCQVDLPYIDPVLKPLRLDSLPHSTYALLAQKDFTCTGRKHVILGTRITCDTPLDFDIARGLKRRGLSLYGCKTQADHEIVLIFQNDRREKVKISRGDLLVTFQFPSHMTVEWKSVGLRKILVDDIDN